MTVILFVRRHPSETAGLMWQPEILPIEYAIATITSPKARAVATKSPHVAPATPHAAKTKTKVPINSAADFLKSVLIFPPFFIFNTHFITQKKSCQTNKKEERLFLFVIKLY